MSKFAKDTSVSVSKSKAEIESIVERYGADQYMSGWVDNNSVIGFRIQEKRIRIKLVLPEKQSREFTHTPTDKERSVDAAHKAYEQACRQKWRAMALIIKAKLEAVDSGIYMIEEIFMSDIVLPNMQTVGEHMLPQIEDAYKDGTMPPMLPYFGES